MPSDSEPISDSPRLIGCDRFPGVVDSGELLIFDEEQLEKEAWIKSSTFVDLKEVA